MTRSMDPRPDYMPESQSGSVSQSHACFDTRPLACRLHCGRVLTGAWRNMHRTLPTHSCHLLHAYGTDSDIPGCMLHAHLGLYSCHRSQGGVHGWSQQGASHARDTTITQLHLDGFSGLKAAMQRKVLKAVHPPMLVKTENIQGVQLAQSCSTIASTCS